MIHKKEFYFIRHGQTDFNISDVKTDHDDVSLNATGLQQAHAVKDLIMHLSVKSICCSPLRRAKETKEIITSGLKSTHYEIPDLGECTLQIWSDMVACGEHAYESTHSHVKDFMDRVMSGINQALSFEGPVLIVAHGGVHWALCCLMKVKEHAWNIPNCIPVHFLIGNKGEWSAKKLM